MTSNEKWDHMTPPKMVGKFEKVPHLHVWSHFNSKVVWLDIYLISKVENNKMIQSAQLASSD